MTPLSFDADTSKEMVGHERTLVIEAKARKDADASFASRDDRDHLHFDPPAKRSDASSYWGEVQYNFERKIYFSQYTARYDKHVRAAEETVDADPALLKIIADVAASQPKAIVEFKTGKEKALNALVGMIIGQCKKTGVAFDATQINTLLKQHIQGNT